MTAPAVAVTEREVRQSILRVIDHAESIWDEWAWQVENKTWNVLGYASWDEMRRAEYGGLTSITAPREERPELVSRFRNAGLTQRQTAETLGVTKRTVERDENPHQLRSTNVDIADVIDAEVVEDDYVTDQGDIDTALADAGFETESETPAPAQSITGRDGKQYARPEPKPAENKERPGSAMSATEADQDRQVQEARDLSRALLTLAAFQYPQARDRYRESWNAQPYARGNGEQFYNPTTIRLIAKSLTTFATELEEA